MERVVVTGLGVHTSNGRNVEEFKNSLYHGLSGLSPINEKRFSTEAKCYLNSQACTIDQDFYESLANEDDTILTKISTMVIADALKDAAVDLSKINKRRVGLCLATTIGGSYPFMKLTHQRVSGPFDSVDFDLHFKGSTPTIAGNLLRNFGFSGPTSTISTACASGTNSIGRAFDLISKGRIDMAVAGGVDIFSELTYSGFNSLQNLSKSVCRPFDKGRDGLTLGDASAFVIVESLSAAQKRGAKIYAEIKGYSAANEAYHPTAPKPDGSNARTTMLQALTQGNIPVEKLDYINAHGTGTGANDGMEINGIKSLVGDGHVFLSSTKSMIGHTLGAAGSIELIATVLGMHHGFIPPSCNVSESLIGTEDNIELVVNKALDYEFDVALSNSFGFGGCMASIAIERFSQAA